MNQNGRLLSFLHGGGETGEIIKTIDWSGTSIGAPETWPGVLRSKLGDILHSGFPMLLFWGEDLLCFYNDAFLPSLGMQGKHPAIGKKAEDVWADVWAFSGPLIRGVIETGKAVYFEDQLVPFYRNGRMEQIYWTFSYSPAYGENGEIGGVLVTCIETTQKVQGYTQLQEAYTQYAFAIEAAELGTWDLNPLTNKFTGNNRLKAWFGLQPGEEIDLQLALNVITEKDRQRVAGAIQRAMEYSSGGLYEIEYTIVNAKGEERKVKAKGRAFFNEEKQPIRFNGILQDITLELIAKYDIRKLLTLVDQSVDLMAILKLDGKNAYINKAGKNILGIDEDADVTEIPIADFHTPEQFAFVTSEIIPAVMAKGRWAGQFAIKQGKTGEIIPLYNNCHRIDDEQTGEPIAIGAVMRDMRPELLAREKLAENEARLNIAIDTSGTGIWDLDMQTGTLVYNDRYLEMLGLQPGTNPSHEQIRNRVHPDDRELRNKALADALQTGMLDLVFRAVHDDGSVHWIKASAKIVFNEDGKPVKQLGTMADITLQQNYAHELEMKVAERTRDLQQLNDELERKNNELASFAYVSSHDLQEPLRKILTFISIVEQGGENQIPAKSWYYFEKIKVSVTRMQALINDLLSFSRTNTYEKLFQPVDILAIIKEMTDSLPGKPVTITLAGMPPINAINFQIHQLFSNLLSNAVKFAKKDRPLQINISGDYIQGAVNYYCITITDNGIGFEPQYNEKIFEVFQRLHRRTEYEGTGIGLAICKKIMDNHRGRITAEGIPGEGAKFMVCFPV